MKSKLVSLGDAVAARDALKGEGKSLVFTNGCFDILHPGHLAYLDEARNLGDALFVGLNSDSSARRLKGPGRPVNDESDRALMLSGLYMVDLVVLFSEDTPIGLIQALTPDTLVKGGDWAPEDIVGGKETLGRGGTVRSLPFLPGHSTTGLISRIVASYSGKAEGPSLR